MAENQNGTYYDYLGIMRETHTDTIFCGELTQPAIDELKAGLGDKAIIPASSARLRRCGFLS